MVCKKYFNLALLTGTVLVSSLAALPVYGKTIDINEEVEAHKKVQMRAVTLVADETEILRAQSILECEKLEKEIQSHRNVIKELQDEKQKHLKKDDGKLDLVRSELKESENKLASVEEAKNNVFINKSKSFTDEINNKKPFFEERVEKFRQNIKDLYQYKANILNGPDAKYWGGFESLDLGMKINFQQEKIDAVWKELMGSTEEKISLVRDVLDEVYSESLSKCRNEVSSIRQKMFKQELELEQNRNSLIKEYDKKIEDVYTTISSLNRKVNEIKRPYNQQITEILQNAEFKVIEGHDLNQSNRNNN